ncbi:MAG: NAD(+)/NADH kinase, partial [Flavobacteriales bacterium]|nr:NAD(+)/NADH kinase [Flavobacteriales bacterium]
MKIALFGTTFNEAKAVYVQHLINKLEQENVDLIIESQFSELLSDIKFKNEYSTFDTPQELKENADIILSIGGDGTLLATITLVRDSGIPILGINTGTLGFISSVSTDQIEYAINHLLKGDYTIKNRTLLQLNSENNLFGDTNFALNEVTVLKKDTSSMIRVHAYLDDEFINT